jgi:hypothetical protein
MNLMMTQKIITLLLVAMSCHLTQAQSDDPFLIGSGGGLSQNGSLFLTYSMGEPCIAYTQSDGHWVTEGFQQPGKINLTSIAVHSTMEHTYRIFPNPTASELHIESKDAALFQLVQITNVLGQPMLSEPITAEQTMVIQIHHLRPGLYFLNILDHSSKAIIQPFIKL